MSMCVSFSCLSFIICCWFCSWNFGSMSGLGFCGFPIITVSSSVIIFFSSQHVYSMVWLWMFRNIVFLTSSVASIMVSSCGASYPGDTMSW